MSEHNGKGRPRKRLTNADLQHAIAIVSLDIARGGKLNYTRCPMHGKESLSYLFEHDAGVYINCELCKLVSGTIIDVKVELGSINLL